jgi:hypothetical protein
MIKDTKLKLLTVEQAAFIALMDDTEVFNVNESLGMEPDYFEACDCYGCATMRHPCVKET